MDIKFDYGRVAKGGEKIDMYDLYVHIFFSANNAEQEKIRRKFTKKNRPIFIINLTE